MAVKNRSAAKRISEAEVLLDRLEKSRPPMPNLDFLPETYDEDAEIWNAWQEAFAVWKVAAEPAIAEAAARLKQAAVPAAAREAFARRFALVVDPDPALSWTRYFSEEAQARDQAAKQRIAARITQTAPLSLNRGGSFGVEPARLAAQQFLPEYEDPKMDPKPSTQDHFRRSPKLGG